MLEEARQALTARADEIRSFEPPASSESATAMTTAAKKIAQLTPTLAEGPAEDRSQESSSKSHAALHEHKPICAIAVAAPGEAPTNSGADTEAARSTPTWYDWLEKQLQAARSAQRDAKLDQLNAQPPREQLERSMRKAALESGRKGIARLLREITSMQFSPGTWPRRAGRRAAQRSLSTVGLFKNATAGETGGFFHCA